uniref:Uncharacterized protein n=1 Tax=Phytophthora ramorum TaxID=164328 RepID=H3H901_PHYRM
MAPTGISGPPASSAQTPSASPGDGSPSGGDVAGESPSVPSQTPPPVDDEEEEVEEELPEEEEAPDDAADESMDAPSGRSSAQTPSRLLLLDRALALQGESRLPSGRDIPHDRQLSAPARYEVPPEHTSGRQVRLVGVPATESHNDGKTFTQNGYGGLEALMQMNELTIGSLAQLYDFFDENVDIHDYVLTPRKKPLSEYDIEHQLSHVGLKREIASILTEFGPENLAQRVFGTVDVLQKVMTRYRRMREQVDDSSSAVHDAVEARDELLVVKQDYQFQTDYWSRKVAEVLAEKDEVVRSSREDITQLLKEHADDKRHLKEQVATLTRRLDDSEAHRKMLSDRLRQTRLEVADVMNFLSDHSQLYLNWPRLRDLLVHFRNGTRVPSGWNTMITVVANDDPNFAPTPYTRMNRPHGDDDGEFKDSGPPSDALTVDLTQDSSSGVPGDSSPKRKRSSGGKSRGSSRKVPDDIQDFPSEWDPTSDEQCLQDTSNISSEQDAHKMLADFPVVWDQLRLDVQMLMRSGVGYSGAVELLDQDQVLHTKFPLDPLLEMLVRMMFWNKLDETPWTKHVPRRYFRAARAKLDDLLEDDVRPPVWDALMSLDQEEDDLIPEVFEPEVDDKTKDGDFVPGEEFELPEDEVIPVDESPPKRTRQKSKRRRTSSSTSGSTPSKKPKRSKRRNDLSATDLARKDFESLTSLEKTIIETPGPSITSWMHLGIRVKRGDPTTLSALQTPGFPDYAPNRFDLDLLKERCDGQELDAPPGILKIQTKRARRHEGFRKKALALQKKLSTKLPSTIWNEPGVWKFPNKICHWILMDKQHFKPGTSECYSLQEQMELLDRREPARAQWSFCTTDAERIAHLPENVRRGLIPADERDPVTDIFS